MEVRYNLAEMAAILTCICAQYEARDLHEGHSSREIATYVTRDGACSVTRWNILLAHMLNNTIFHDTLKHIFACLLSKGAPSHADPQYKTKSIFFFYIAPV